MEVKMIALPGAKANMVAKVCVANGDMVVKGQDVAMVESKKGVRAIKSPMDGMVANLSVAEGDMVDANVVIMTIEEAVPAVDIKMIALPGAKANMVAKVCIAVGDVVAKGQDLIMVESKKGVRAIKSPDNGKIATLLVAEGDMVEAGVVVATMEMCPQQEADGVVDLVIMGGGPGGYVAGIYAAKKGLSVTIVEQSRLGGTCLNVGCIPTKSLIKSSEVYHHITNSDQFGLGLTTANKVDLGKVIDRKNGIVDTLVGGIEGLMDKNNITVLEGTARFVDAHSVEVVGDTNMVIPFKNCIIATGSKIARPQFIKGINSEFVLDSTSALNLRELPDSLAIIGGGVIGMEFAFLMRGFGVDVTVIEYADHLLGNTDSDLTQEIYNIAIERGIKVHLSSGVTSCESTANGGLVHFTKNSTEMSVQCDKALLAFGRVTCIDGIGLDKAGVALTERNNAIKVDNAMATNVDNIYAIGDVNALIQLAHSASHMGIVAVNNILGHKETFDINTVPSVIFTSPEIATVGISEDMAKSRGTQYKVGKFQFANNGKALAMGEPVGFVKLISDNNGIIIGGSVIGPDAGTIIATITLAVQNKMKDTNITDTIFAHPTTAEAIHEAAMGLTIGCLHQ